MRKTIIDKALKHLNEDPKIRQIILNQNYPVFKKAQDPFIALSKSIIFQQLSGRSANAIYQRFINLYKSKPSAKNLLNIDDKKYNLVYPSEIDETWIKETSKPKLDKPRLLYVGRIKIEKGIFSLLKILKNVKSDISLSILGKNEDNIVINDK